MRIRFQADADLRLPIVSGVKRREPSVDFATAHEFCVDVKHSADPSLLFSDDTNYLDARDQRRHQAVLWLEHSLRELFSKALEEPDFADELADASVLENRYPV